MQDGGVYHADSMVSPLPDYDDDAPPVLPAKQRRQPGPLDSLDGRLYRGRTSPRPSQQPYSGSFSEHEHIELQPRIHVEPYIQQKPQNDIAENLTSDDPGFDLDAGFPIPFAAGDGMDSDSDSGTLYGPDVDPRSRDIDDATQSRLVSKTRPKTMSRYVYSVMAGMPSHRTDASMTLKRSLTTRYASRKSDERKSERKRKRSGGTDEEEGSEEEEEEMDEAELRSKLQTIRGMPTTLWVKRLHRDRLQTQKQRYGLDSLTRATGLKIYGFKEKVKEKLEYIHIWGTAFKDIEGKFGPAILSYFRFIRWMFFLNIFISLVMFFVLTFPLILFPPKQYSEYLIVSNLSHHEYAEKASVCSLNYSDALATTAIQSHINKTTESEIVQHVLDFLQGTGFMENTHLFYGFYTNTTYKVSDTTINYNTSLAYMLAIGVCFFISFLLILANSAESIKSSNSAGHEDVVTLYSNKVFCGWDFCISNTKKAHLKHRNIGHELAVDLDEQNRMAAIRSRTIKTWLKLYTIRILVNIIVLVCILGSLAVIYIASDSSLKWLECRAKTTTNEFLNLLMQYLPSLSISGLNVIMPIFFAIIVPLEEYSPSFQIYITLARIVVLRLASFGILVVSLYIRLLYTRKSNPIVPGICPHMNDTTILDPATFECGNKEFESNIMCWETYVGQQIFKLCLLDFFVIVLQTFLVEFPRKFVYRRFNRFAIVRWVGIQEFNIPENVLDLVYSQTLCWFGTFFSPLIPVMCSLKCLFIFYMKKGSLLINCNPPKRPYRASKSHSFFMLILLIAFIIAMLAVGYVVGNKPPSQSCGPFRLYSSSVYVMVDTIWIMLQEFPLPLDEICLFVTSVKFIVPIAIVLLFTMYTNWAFAQANKKKSKMLREQLAMIGRDKRFLLDRVHDAERRRHVGRHANT